MKSKSYFTKFEIFLWLFSVATVILAFLLPQEKNILNLISSLIGVTALIFVAKGNVIGQVLTVIFAVFYGIVSFFFNYYGEMITYLGMTAPIALISIFSWLSHPSKTKNEVKVGHITLKSGIFMIISAIIVTSAFYSKKARNCQSYYKYSLRNDKFLRVLSFVFEKSVLCGSIFIKRSGSYHYVDSRKY